MLKEFKIIIVIHDDRYSWTPTLDETNRKLNELNEKGWEPLSLSQMKSGDMMVLLSRDKRISNLE